jgi:heme/copper-type cytochrome/quinol oxidase subunit 3
MTTQRVLDVSDLPDYAFGHRGVLWWATVVMIAIESAVFAVAIVSYFYLRGNLSAWPPPGTPPPLLIWGILNTAIFLISAIPNHYLEKRAEQEDLRGVRIGLILCVLLGIAFIVVRVLEYKGLQTFWNTDAYGSVAWTLLSLHTAHIVTDFLDTLTLLVMTFATKIDGKRFVDISENGFYWYFVVLTWLPIFAVLYITPRL